MMFKKRRNIERATLFKATFFIADGGPVRVRSREFISAKSMNQWIGRWDNCFRFMLENRHALIDEQWEPITTIGKKTVTLSELKRIVRQLEEAFVNEK